MKKLLVALFLCSSILCQAKDFYYEGISFEYQNRMGGGVKLYPKGCDAEDTHWVFLSLVKNSPNNPVVLLNNSLLSISCTKNKNSNPEKVLTEIIDKTWSESSNMPKKLRVKSISDIQDGIVGNYPCKFIDIEKPKGVRIRAYCFKKGDYFIQLTVSWFGVKKLEKFEEVIAKLKVVDTFDFVPE